MTYIVSDQCSGRKFDKDDSKITEGVLCPCCVCQGQLTTNTNNHVLFCCILCPVVLTVAENKFKQCPPCMSLPPPAMNHPWGSAAQVLWLLSKVRTKCPGKRWICLCPRGYSSFLCVFVLLSLQGRVRENSMSFSHLQEMWNLKWENCRKHWGPHDLVRKTQDLKWGQEHSLHCRNAPGPGGVSSSLACHSGPNPNKGLGTTQLPRFLNACWLGLGMRLGVVVCLGFGALQLLLQLLLSVSSSFTIYSISS